MSRRLAVADSTFTMIRSGAATAADAIPDVSVAPR
jgi:hypothetical protein